MRYYLIMKKKRKDLKNKNPVQKTAFPKIKNILRENKFFIILLVFVCAAVYFNVLAGEFLVVDDLSGFVNNEQIRNLPESLKNLQIQTTVYALSYQFFGINPLPLHLISLFLHIGVTILVFIFLYLLFGKEVSLIASLLFAVHPVNTEAISWISGAPYLYHALFTYLIIISHLVYKQNKNNLYFFTAITLFSLALVIIRSPWVLVMPIALVIIDQFFLEKKISFKSFSRLLLFAIPIIIFYLTSFQESYTTRVSYRQDGTHSAMNQQSLKPVIESYPYTIYSMLKLYLFPRDLTVYYDGNIITNMIYVSMFIVSILFVCFIVYSWRKNRRTAGLLIILPLLIAPTFSPIKITWFIAERYLYLGSAFFCTLVAMLVLKLEDKTKIKHLSLILTILLLTIYSARTILRNNDWKDSKSLALATIKTSPYSVRPYNDLGGVYFMEKNIEKAKEYYQKALEVNPSSNTAMSNLGLIYLQNGLPEFAVKTAEEITGLDSEPYQQPFNQGTNAFQNKQNRLALYYFSQALAVNPSFVEAIDAAGIVYLKENEIDFAIQQFKKSLKIQPNREESLYMLGFAEYKKKNFQVAKEYLIKTLEINPDHTEAQQNLKMLEEVSPAR